MRLPLFLTRRHKYLAGVMVYFVCAFFYLVSNHFPVFQPRQLGMTFVDQNTPFLPWTIWIYISEWIFFIAVYVICRDMINLNKYLYSQLALWAVSVVIFLLFPTTFPRENFPLPGGLNATTLKVFSFLRAADAPTNCCPSLHVSSVYLSSFIFREEQQGKLPFFIVWGTLIAVSTLTTKQHYMVDVVAGFAMASFFYWVFYRWVRYFPLHANR